MTGIGPVAVRQPRVRDREAAADDPDRIRFSPSILPPYVRRSKSIETLLPILYLKGISTGDFSEALAALLGKDAAGLSASADRPPEGRLARRARRVAEARSVGQALRLHLGRWHPSRSPARRRKAVHPRADRRDAGGPQGTGRLHRWRPRERARLARSAARSEAARARRGPAARHRRWRARVLEGCRRGLAENARAALLGAQDRQRARQAAEEPAPEGQTRVAGDLDGRNEGRRRGWRSTPSSRATRPNTRRRPTACARIETRCWLSTTSRPSTGNTCARPTPSKAPSPPCATARSDRRAVYPTRPRSRWSSNWSRARRKAGAVSMATTSCQNSFSV